MLKKLFTALTICSILSISGVSALAASMPNLVTDFTVTPSSFDPSSGESATVSFDLAEYAEIYSYVTDAHNNVVVTLANHQQSHDGPNSYIFYGTVENSKTGTFLADGVYTVKTFAIQNGAYMDYDYQTVTITSKTANSAPTISNLKVTPPSFSADDNETTTISFTTDEGAYLKVFVGYINNAGTFVALTKFDDYNYQDWYSAGPQSLVWDGTNMDGNDVEDGSYVVQITAENNVGKDTDSVTVEVYTSDVPPIPNPTYKPDVTSLKVTPSNFTPEDGETTNITFSVDEDAYLTVVVKDGSTVMKTFSAYDNDHYTDGPRTVKWDGKDNDGDYVAEGYYTVLVNAENSKGEDSASVSVYVNEDTVVESGLVTDFQLDPSNTWDPSDDDELEISFELTDDVDDLTIIAKKSGEDDIEIFDDEDLDEDYYEEFWDGTDEDGDFVEAGVWTIIIEADGYKFPETIEVKYDLPEISEAFVTKDSFDNEEGEFTTLVFKVDTDAVVTVQVYDGTHKELTLVDEEDVNGDDWYWVSWDGMDEDDDEVDYGTEWKFKITAESLVDDKIEDVVSVDFDIEEDDASSKKSNITNDYNAPVVFDEDEDDSIEFYFCMEDEAEVYLAVYSGTSASGSAKAELLDYVELDAGCHTVKWNGLDDDDDDLKDGIYSYKLITKVGSNKETETGRFVIGDAAGSTKKKDSDKKDVPVVGTCSYYYWDMGYLASDNELCQAITWVTEEGIFNGYPDGSFGAYKNINRAEVLKVVLRAFDAPLLPANGSDFGFWDVDPSAWYMTYVRTGKFYGMLDGYPDGSLKLANNINRVEMLKLMLEASDKFTSYELVTGMYETLYADVQPKNAEALWFYDYATAAYEYDLYNTEVVNGQEYLYPAQLVERGEVALLLYRMQKAGLLDR